MLLERLENDSPAGAGVAVAVERNSVGEPGVSEEEEEEEKAGLVVNDSHGAATKEEGKEEEVGRGVCRLYTFFFWRGGGF